MNGLTWKNLREAETRQERKEKLYSILRFAVIIFVWFSVGFITGRFFEAIALGNIF